MNTLSFFGLEADGPFDWYLRDKLPSKDELKARFPPGSNLSVEFFEVADPDRVLQELAAQGMRGEQPKLREARPAEWKGPEYRIEGRQKLGTRFERAIAKVSFNYFVHQFGPAMALDPLFDDIRTFVRCGDRPDWLHWEADRKPFSFQVPHSDGHVVGIAFDESEKNRVVGLTSFFMFARYRITLSKVGFKVLCSDRVHFFDCTEMTARSLKFA